MSSLLPSSLPLYHEDIEQALLSILLRHNEALEDLPGNFSKEVFFHPLHQRIFHSISLMHQRNHLANPLTLGAYFKTPEEDHSSYLLDLGALSFPLSSCKDYALHLYELFLRRQLLLLSQELTEKIQDVRLEAPSAAWHIEHIESQLFSLSQWGKERGPQFFSKALHHAISMAEIAYGREDRIVGVSTGFRDMDKLLGGLHPSDLIILAGRPSMGKTALATNIAFNAAHLAQEKKGGAGVVFFSLEMSANQLAMRLLGQESGISSDRIRRGAIDQKDFGKFMELSQKFHDLPLLIDDTPALSVASLLTRARRLKRKHDIGLVVIDYLQLLQGNGQGGENRVQELSEITRGLKMMAKDLEVPVLALSQLSRAVEQREDKRPQLSDLRESGTIEQDADVVMFVYREEYYESRKKPSEGSEKMALWQKNMNAIYNVAEVIIAKQRHGPISTVSLHFDGQKTKFSDLQEPTFL